LARLARRGVRCRSLALVGWQISANLGRHVRAGADARGWRWEITRGADVAQFVIEVSGRAWSADPVSLPDDTRRALETDGRAEPLKVLGRDKPPLVIRCGCSGCSYLAARGKLVPGCGLRLRPRLAGLSSGRCCGAGEPLGAGELHGDVGDARAVSITSARPGRRRW
jgi:hypothetical protein